MRIRYAYILAWALSALVLTSCSDNEILTTYEEVKEQADPVPLVFNPYINTSIESEATTRANLNYLTSVISSGKTDSGLENFSTFPWFDETAALNQSWDIDGVGSLAGYRNTGLKPNYRFGKATINSYIVGIYGYYDSNSANGWVQLSASPTLTANFMTNQPLRHLNEKPENAEDYDYNNAHWEYSPLRYWPNSTNNAAKVSFISYYPFQDFAERGIGINSDGKYTFEGYYRNGRDWKDDPCADFADLTCITPPANDAIGKDAYLFTFKQNEKIENHIDFLLGLDQDKTKQAVGSSGITLTMKHTLCAVMFDLRTNGLQSGVTYEINSVSLEGLYGKGKVYPTTSDPVWEPQYLEEGNTTYTLDFYEHRDIFNGYFDKPIFIGGKGQIRYHRNLIYQNKKDKSRGTIKVEGNDFNIVGNNVIYVDNSRGMECLMLVIPQLVEKDKEDNPKDAYLVVNYDMTVDYGDGNIIVYKNNEEKIKLKDEVVDKDKKTYKRQLFQPGRFMVFNILFDGPKQITMDAYDTDWEAEDERQVPIEDKQTGDNGGE